MMRSCSSTLKTVIALVLFTGVVISVTGPTQARQFRLLTPIAGPEQEQAGLPPEAQPVDEVRPLSSEEVEPMVRKLIEQWNTPGMAQTLSEQFHDKSRLMDAVDTVVPRDAKLRIQAIRGIQTLQQYLQPDPGGGRGTMVSIVSATVQTQLEFNSPAAGFVRLPGTNEFILEVTSAAPP